MLQSVLGYGLAGLLTILGLATGVAQARGLRRQGDASRARPGFWGLQAYWRLFCAGIMLLLAGTMSYGLWLTPPGTPAEKRAWASAWLATMLLVLVLLVLGLCDWLAIRFVYGQARQRLAAQRRVVLELEIARRNRRGQAGGNGAVEPPSSS